MSMFLTAKKQNIYIKEKHSTTYLRFFYASLLSICFIFLAHNFHFPLTNFLEAPSMILQDYYDYPEDEFSRIPNVTNRGVEKGAKSERAKNCWISCPNMEKTRDSTQSSLSKYERSSVFPQ